MARGRPQQDRPRAGRALLIAGVLLAVVALGLTGLRLAVLDEGRFVAAAGKAISEPAVSEVVGDRITDRLIAAEPDLLTVQPVVRSATIAAVGSSAAQGLVRTAARQLHRTAVAGDPDTAVLRLGNLGLLAVQTLRTLSPNVAKQVPEGIDEALVSIDDGQAADVIGAVTEAGHTLRLLSWLATVLALGLLVGSVLVRRDRMAALRTTGLGIAAAGLGTIVVHLIVRAVTVGALTGSGTREIGFAVYDAFLGDVVSLGTAAIATGLVLVVAVGALTRRESLTTTVRRRLSGIDDDPRGRRLLAGLTAAAGATLLLDRELALRAAATVAGVALLVVGLEVLLRSGAEARGEDPATSEETPDEQDEPARPRPLGARLKAFVAGTGLRRGIAVGVALVIGLVVIGGATEQSLSTPRFGPPRCNGDAALCDLRLDQVVLASTHNSNAAADDGFLLANQESGIADQLAGGIRGFLIDTHEGQRTSRGVYTRIEEGTNSRKKIEEGIGPDATRTALRLRGSLNGGDKQPSEVFLCHGFCELGAVRAVDSLRDIRNFLLANPDEVVILSVEDQTTPQRFADVMRESGLLDLVWKGSVSPMPTLGEMVRDGGRVLVMVEEDAGTIPWMHQQFEISEDTPYNLQTAKQLLGDEGCAVNRGPRTAPLFLMNHFLGTVPPRPSEAVRVNSRSALLEQVDHCRKLRDRTANLLAVDFWKVGDVVGVTRELNEQIAREHG